MATTPKPPVPKRLIFFGKNIPAKAMPVAPTFGKSQNGNWQLAVAFATEQGARAQIYAVPEGSNLAIGKFEEIPAGSMVTMIKTITPATKKYVEEALRAAGWKGNSMKALAGGQLDGLGEPVCRLQVSVKETDQNENWRMTQPTDGKQPEFNPQMEVEFVNSAGGFAFKNKLEAADLDALDAFWQTGATPAAPNGSATSGAGGAAAGAGGGQTKTDDDIPF